MSRTVAVLQSNYIPWKGYFDIIRRVDLFVFYDDVQFTPRDWRTRNRIKTRQGLKWLTIPCGRDRNRLVCEVRPSNSLWQSNHWKLLLQEYRRARHFESLRPFFEDFYLARNWTNLSELNQHLIRHIARDWLSLETRFDDSRRYPLQGAGAERILALLKQVEATEYVTGPAARSYLDPDQFEREGIELTWMDYAGYPEYPQFHPPFVHEVSIVDLLFHEGPNAARFLERSVESAPRGSGRSAAAGPG